MCSLENINDKGELESKADIFTKRTIRAQQEITTAETPEDALAISISEKGHVDLTYMAELLGSSVDYLAYGVSTMVLTEQEIRVIMAMREM